ncbi:DUF1622 domain-containing protein [uncultured Traorella sp.]|jgi:uncharacterized membrane protein|uniref:DUF1622 domain-containing protein n=1 Tax=uncultured Traorella sp. TaxID=1929048 RepID=UPI0025FA429D|nr:DUF1622 domain-containing protein [uncultured Traorella sp.]
MLTLLLFSEAATENVAFFERIVEFIVPEIIGIIELMGIIVIVVGSVKSFYMYGRSLLKHVHYPIKLSLGNALALGLEFKMGAEILKTVTIRTINEIMILGAIIVLRALLSVLIHYEVKNEKEHNQDMVDMEF